MSNTAPSRADPVVVFPLGRWCPPQETSQPPPPPPPPPPPELWSTISWIYGIKSSGITALCLSPLIQNEVVLTPIDQLDSCRCAGTKYCSHFGNITWRFHMNIWLKIMCSHIQLFVINKYKSVILSIGVTFLLQSTSLKIWSLRNGKKCAIISRKSLTAINMPVLNQQ